MRVLHCYVWPKWRNWQTRTTQNRVPSGVRVRLPPSALLIIRSLNLYTAYYNEFVFCVTQSAVFHTPTLFSLTPLHTGCVYDREEAKAFGWCAGIATEVQ